MTGVRLSGVGVRLGDTEVLRDVTLELDARTIAIVGDNGSGKSTLLRILAGLTPVTSGTARVLGLDPTRQAAELRRRVAVVFSNPDAQIVMPTVDEDVAFSLRSEKLPAAERAARVAAALARFGLADLAERSAHDLSGGQKQLLALCGAFVRDPDLVIADEPTAYLDRRNARHIADHLFASDTHGLIMATHDLELARRCEAAVHVVDGRIAAVGAADQIADLYEAALRW